DRGRAVKTPVQDVSNSSALGHDARKGCALWRKTNSEAVVTACPPAPSVPILQQRNRHSRYKPSPSSSISENHESHRGKLPLRNKPSAHAAVVPDRLFGRMARYDHHRHESANRRFPGSHAGVRRRLKGKFFGFFLIGSARTLFPVGQEYRPI